MATAQPGCIPEKRDGIQDDPKPKNKFKNYCPPGVLLSPTGPPATTASSSNKTSPTAVAALPNVLICFRSKKSEQKAIKEKSDRVARKDADDVKRVKRSKSRELRSGILYVGCECERRNGLQDQCPRLDCRGLPECLTVPPTCGPSEFANAKHLTAKIDAFMKRKKEYMESFKRAYEAENNRKAIEPKEKIDYDCFPLDQMLQDGQPCPICDHIINLSPKQPLPPPMQDSKQQNTKGGDLYVGPVIIDFPDDCNCSPEAS